MANLKTKYLGLELNSPIIVGACNLSDDISKLKEAEDSGAGAVVYKSLFEEQIHLENLEQDEILNEFNNRNAEMLSVFPSLGDAGPEEHLLKLKKAKEALGIPLIASVNSVYDYSWVEHAKKIEETGVDALELNLYHVPVDFDKDASAIEKHQLEIVKRVKDKLSIPVSVKLSPYYSNVLNFITAVDKLGAEGVVLFNKLFQPQIDIENEKNVFPWNLSSSSDARLPLRFAGLLAGNIDADVCSSSGIFEGADVVQQILAGASAVQVVSTLYQNKVSHITKMLGEVEAWMNRKGYASVDDFKGKLSRKNTDDKYAYKRAQYVDILFKSKEIFKKYPL